MSLPAHWTAAPPPKAFHGGTHRAALPEETLARAWPHAAAAGVTRLGVLTGLDTLGIPVAAAYRPNSRTLAVHQGKGLTLAAAKASALMEAIETFHAEAPPLPLRLGSAAELGRGARVLDPATLPLLAPGDLADARCLWADGVRLADGGPVLVPYELVAIDLAPDAPGPALFQATSNGLASGNHPLEALTHGLCEAIERDAVALWHAAPVADQDARALDLATIPDGAAQGWIAAVRAAGLALRVWEVTSDIAVPAFACLLAGGADVLPELGFGCHPDPAVALLRAIGEAAQARLTVISGAREDVALGGYGDRAVRARDAAALGWMASPGIRDFAAAPGCATPTLEGDFRAVLAALAAAGLTEAAAVELTRPEIGLPVMRVVVPGLEGPWSPPGGGYRPGPRAMAQAA
jgi:YcaO-like protein with predicted kinase domain